MRSQEEGSGCQQKKIAHYKQGSKRRKHGEVAYIKGWSYPRISRYTLEKYNQEWLRSQEGPGCVFPVSKATIIYIRTRSKDAVMKTEINLETFRDNIF